MATINSFPIELKELSDSPEFQQLNETIAAIQQGDNKQWFYSSTMGGNPTDTLPLPTLDIAIRVMDAVADTPYTNLKTSSGGAVAGISFTATEVAQPFLYFVYKASTNTWGKLVQSIPTIDLTNSEIATSKNLLDPQYIVANTIVGSTGNVVTNPAYVGAYTVKMPCSAYVGQYITISGYNNPAVGKYVVFKNASNATVGTISNLNATYRNFLVPAGAATFNAYVKQADSVETTPLGNIMINIGQTPLPYEPWQAPIVVVTKIDSKDIKAKYADTPVNANDIANKDYVDAQIASNPGGAESFEDLIDVPAYAGNAGKVMAVKITEDGLEAVDALSAGADADLGIVTADSVSAGQIIAGSLVVNLPEGAGTVPAGVDVGEAWIDTSAADVIKVRRS